MLQQHPNAELLTEFSSGALTMSHALCVATHLEHCEACRDQVSKLESLGGCYFAEQPAQSTASLDKLKERLLACLEQTAEEGEPPEAPSPQPATATEGYWVPRSLGQFVAESYDELEWQRVSGSIKVALLCRDRDGSQVALTRVSAGGKMPHHAHTGQEITVVLEGSFSDEDGLYRKGDMICRDAGEKHSPVVTNDGECICLAVLEGPIQFTGFFTRWLNPLLRRQHGLSV